MIITVIKTIIIIVCYQGWRCCITGWVSTDLSVIIFVIDHCGLMVWFWQQEGDSTLRKAQALKSQRREEYQRARSSTNRSQEELSNNAANKQLEKKRRLEEEALQKVGRSEGWQIMSRAFFLSLLIISVITVRRRRLGTSTRFVWLTLASEGWIWPTLRAQSSHRSGKWSFSVTSHSKL